MASVSKRTRNGQVSWVARWRAPDGTQAKRVFRRKVDAERFSTGVEHSQLTGSYVDPTAGRTTVRDWSALWTAQRVHLKPKTVASCESLLRSQVLPRWDSVPLSNVTHAAVVAWVSEMRAGGLSASRCRQSYHLLTAMLDDAVKDGKLARNQAAGINLPRLPKTDRRYLTHDQVDDLADACATSRTVVLLLAYTGLRWGEATALRVRHVDLLRRRVDVAEAVVEVNGRMIFGTPESHQTRAVAVPRFRCDNLAAQMAGKTPDDLIFTSTVGTVLRTQSWRRRCFDPAVRSVGLDGLVPHELRHTAASLAIASGANVKAVQAMLCHASATLTLDRYGHLFPDDLDAVADRIDAARSARVPPVCPESTVTPLLDRRSRP